MCNMWLLQTKWEISQRRINALCLEGRLEGAIKFGNTWAIPDDLEKSSDARVKDTTKN